MKIKKIKNLALQSYKDVLAVAVIWAVVTVLVIGFFDLLEGSLKVPLSYSGGDDFSIYNTVRMVQESGWNTGTDRLSAMDEYYYNNNEIISGLHQADVFLAGVFLFVGGGDVFLAANLVYLSIFYLASLIMYVVLRLLGINRWIAGSGALVYAFLAFVFMRGMGHISLSSHYFVPLAVLMALWVYEDEKFMLSGKGFFKYRRNIGGLIMAFLVAVQGIGYWQVFGCFILLIAAVTGWFKNGDRKAILRGITAIGAIVVCVLVCCIPVFVSMAVGGSMAASGRPRFGTEGEAYGLKIVQLFLPVNGHGIDAWQECLDLYNENMPLVNENSSAYLGLVGIVGFLVLCVWLVLGRTSAKANSAKDARLSKRLTLLADINICAVLLATVGGFGSMLYLAGFNILRSYNRISVYIACISIVAACLCVQWLYERIKNAGSKILYVVVVIAFMLFAVWEQNPGYEIDYEGNKNAVESDAAFVADIESVMDEDDKVFQLPYVAFPEDEAHYDMQPLEHLKGFIASDKLRWSYGAMPQSESDIWYRETADMDAAYMVAEVSKKGFDGVYINRAGYTKEQWMALEKDLEGLLGVEPIVSKDERLSFFKLR